MNVTTFSSSLEKLHIHVIIVLAGERCPSYGQGFGALGKKTNQTYLGELELNENTNLYIEINMYVMLYHILSTY